MARQFSSEDSQNGQKWVKTMIALALAFLGQRSGDPAIVHLTHYEALDEIPGDELVLRDVADILYCMTLGRRGEIDRSAEVAIKCLQRRKAVHQTLATSRREEAIPALVSFLARTYLMQGCLHAAASLCREYLDPIQEKGLRFIHSAGNMNIVLGEAQYEWNSLQEAEKQIRNGLQANEPWVDIMSDAFGLLALTRLLCAKGDYYEAMQVVEKFETRLQDRSRPHEFEEDFRTLRVRVQLASGELQNAIHWADQLHKDEDFRRHTERYHLTLARIRLAQGRYAEVEELLSGTPPATWAGNRITRQIESRLLLAAALAGQIRLPDAYGLIDTCLTLAEPEGYLRVFLDFGEQVRKLLATYLHSTAPGHKLYAQIVLDAFATIRGAGVTVLQPGELVEPLSGRELEVLHLMSLGKTNAEIARQLIVAPGTIKAHAASIYRKLDVANRTEAVTRARQFGIFN